MKLFYNLTGPARKSLVAAISQTLNAPTKYLGAPTFGYEVGDYHIDKTGTLTGPDSLDLEDALHQAGFDAPEREYDEPDTYESGLGEMGDLDELPDIDQHHPSRHANPNAPITEALQRQIEEDGLTIEMPRSFFTDTALDNLGRLVNSKGSLIKKALGTEKLELHITEDKVGFPWFGGNTDPDAVKAYTHFVTALCEMARVQKRVTARQKETDNEKYAFRCFLLRLGFIGDEHKSARKILLRNLSGSSAFKIPKSEATGDE
jgi:hypothetical protein